MGAQLLPLLMLVQSSGCRVLAVWVRHGQMLAVHMDAAFFDPFLGCAQGIDAAVRF